MALINTNRLREIKSKRKSPGKITNRSPYQMRKRNTKDDCKVQILALEIITPLNECTGGRSRVFTQHKHNRRGMQTKIREKSRESHNHKSQPFPDEKEEYER